MTDRERLFDWCVDQMQSGRMTLDQCIEQHAGDDPDLAEMLCTVATLRGLATPDMRDAKVRVRARLAASMSRDVAPAPQDSDGPGGRPVISPAPPAPTSRAARPRRVRRAFVGLAAAVLLACGLVGLGVGQAAADALPGSPLYAVKRAEEWTMVHTAFSDGRRGVVLATLADHRLAEASAESRAGNVSQARALLREYDDDVRQALALSAAMNAHGQDARPVLGAVAVDLAHATQLQYDAAHEGNGPFAQMLQASLASDRQLIHSNHLALPDVTVAPNRQGQSTASPGSQGHQGGAKATPSSSSTTADGHPTPPGIGNGNGTGSGSGHGHGTPTPSGH